MNLAWKILIPPLSSNMKNFCIDVICFLVPVSMTAGGIFVCLSASSFPWWYILINEILGLPGFWFLIARPSPNDCNTPPYLKVPGIRAMHLLALVGYVALTVFEFIFFAPWWMILLVVLLTVVFSFFAGRFASLVLSFLPILLSL